MDWKTFVIQLLGTLGVGAILGVVVEAHLEHRRARRRDADKRRSRVIAHAYGCLDDLEVALQLMVSPDGSMDDASRRRRRAAELADLFRSKFQRARLWFDPATCQAFDRLWEHVKSAIWAQQDAQSATGAPEDKRKARDEVHKQIPVLKAELEAEFQRALGISRVANRLR